MASGKFFGIDGLPRRGAQIRLGVLEAGARRAFKPSMSEASAMWARVFADAGRLPRHAVAGIRVRPATSFADALIEANRLAA
jgi:hypothetical protein